MYTEIHLNAELRRDAPQQVLETLAYMTGTNEQRPEPLPDHELFKAERWEGMLRCESYYFPLSVASSLDYDDIAQCHYLRVRSNFKNYSSEIAAFLEWVMPWVAAGDECLGYYRYEEDNDPTLIYKSKG